MAERPGAPTGEPGEMQLYRFAGLVLDLERFALDGPDGPVAAEPRTIELLAYLLAHRHRLVGKDELIDAVWKGQAISDSAISRGIYQVRQAVGDDARHPTVVVTVHGRGYRIAENLAVEAVAAREPPNSPLAGSASSHGPSRRGWRRVAPPLAAALAALLAVALWIGRGSPGSRPWPPAARILRLAIVPPSAETRLAGLRVCDALSARLESNPGVLVRGCAAADESAIEAASLTELAARLGVDAVVSGSLAEGRLACELLDLRAAAAGSRQRLPVLQLADPPASGGGLAAAVDELAGEVLRRLGQPDTTGPAWGRSQPPGRPATLYLRAISSTGLDCVGGGRLELLAAAIDGGGDFPAAELALAGAHLERAALCGDHPQHYESALDALERAGAPPAGSGAAAARAALAAEALLGLGRLEPAYAAIEAAEAPGADPRLDWTAARVLIYAGQPAAAAARARRALAADPDHDLHGWTTGLLAAELGGSPGLRSRTDPAGLFARGLIELRAGEAAAAAASLRPTFRADPANVYARLAEALQAVAEGTPDQALDILRPFDRARLGLGGGDPVVDYRIGQLLALAGDAEGAARALARIRGFVWPVAFERDPLWRRSALAAPPPDALAGAGPPRLAAAAGLQPYP